MRAHLIMNPEARGVTPALIRIVNAALEARFKLESSLTTARDAGIEVARNAVGSGAELIIAFGGDGLVNEVINGMAGSDATLAIIPGGTMNVLSRNLGLPRDPIEATDNILTRYLEVKPRTLRLGKANDRLFGFACGTGFDAEAAARVEAHKKSKRRFGEPYFYVAALAVFFKSYFDKEPFLLCQGEFGKRDAVMTVGLTAGPYAYLFGRPIRLSEGIYSEGSMDLFILRRLSYLGIPAYASGALITGRFGSNSESIRSLSNYRVTADLPFAVHVDGEPLMPTDHLDVLADSADIQVLV